ncbi:response regulator [Pelomonas sp. SE-A7]|uniref:response regulator n=1 Tax=Pelomonas sp. SE-A7 TaxID=3054953 RepID=UPI00259C844B|nr:response regulator [Pelomonas sp. SE-A7]MDM4767566.1 response regulator [Pelomonas sp. SE-A7]
MNDDDDLLVLDEEDEQVAPDLAPPWNILVVDDDEGVHEVTRLLMQGRRLEGRSVRLLHAYSAAEGEQALRDQPEIGMLLLDVVMETEMAGLLLVERIRRELNNHRARIIIRTGQPGLLSEDELLRRYDVNGYCLKTQLTDAELNRICLLALRNYRDIVEAAG